VSGKIQLGKETKAGGLKDPTLLPAVRTSALSYSLALKRLCLKIRFCAKGAKCESQGQARSVAERVAPGK
jgi:hypothetical protein